MAGALWLILIVVLGYFGLNLFPDALLEIFIVFGALALLYSIPTDRK